MGVEGCFLWNVEQSQPTHPLSNAVLQPEKGAQRLRLYVGYV